MIIFANLGLKGEIMKACYLSLVKTDTGGGGVYFGFQVTGMTGGFCGFESFDSGIFGG